MAQVLIAKPLYFPTNPSKSETKGPDSIRTKHGSRSTTHGFYYGYGRYSSTSTTGMDHTTRAHEAPWSHDRLAIGTQATHARDGACTISTSTRHDDDRDDSHTAAPNEPISG